MKPLSIAFAVLALAAAFALIAMSRPSQAAEVTVKGMVLNNVHTGESRKSVFIYALDGTPEIRAEVERIMSECFPEKGLDGDAARKLQDRFTAKLKYYITGPHADELYTKATYGARQHTAVTGTVIEKDGRRWINVSKVADTVVHYPPRMLATDKPLVSQDRPPLLLKINDKLTLKCPWVPPGKFFMGEPYYQCPHWQEAPPHLVTLTKGFYMSECPITEAMYTAVAGDKSLQDKSADAPINASCAMMYKFCRALSQSTQRTIRVPTAAEWEYAARVGTSNPAFREKYKEQDSSGVQPPRVMRKLPNAWGFYDMFSSGWERVSDGSAVLGREDASDPRHIPREDQCENLRNQKHGHFGKGNSQFAVSEIEYITSEAGPVTSYPGAIRFRIAVEGP